MFHPDSWTFCKNATMPVCCKYFIKHQPTALQVHCTCVDVYSFFFFFTVLGFGCRSSSRSHWSCWVFFPSLVYHKVMCSLYYFAVHEIWVNRYPPPTFLFLRLQPTNTTLGWGLRRTTAPPHPHPGDSSSQEGFHNCHLSVCANTWTNKQGCSLGYPRFLLLFLLPVARLPFAHICPESFCNRRKRQFKQICYCCRSYQHFGTDSGIWSQSMASVHTLSDKQYRSV